MKKIICFVCMMFGVGTLSAQYSIEECYELAKENYPLAQQRGLIEQSAEYNLSNARRGHLPQFALTGQATYQTDVTAIPVPGFQAIPNDQYKVALELNQTIWDGGVISSQKKGISAAAEVENRRLEVDLYTLHERVNGLYFGILLLEEQLEMNRILDGELERNSTKVAAYIASGVANQADMDAVQVEILANNQRRAEYEETHKAYLQMLSALLGVEVKQVLKPMEPNGGKQTILRPELDLFEAQITQLDAQRSAIAAKNMPKISLFAQGAYGNPGLNMLKPGFVLFGVGGIRMTWNFGGLYTKKQENLLINLQQQKVNTVRNAFLLNIDLAQNQTDGEIQKLRRQMSDDDQIIALRRNIKASAEAKVEGGTMSVLDMLREVTAENSALQTRSLHEIQLLLAYYNLKYVTNH